MLRKKALIKMIDTYIRQLNEIRSDINSMITEDTSDLTTCSNEGAAKYIVAMLKDRSNNDIQEIFKEVELRLELLDRDIELRSTKSHNRMSYDDITEMLLNKGYRFIVRLDRYNSSKWVILVDNNGKELFGFNFDSEGLLKDFGVGFELGYETH